MRWILLRMVALAAVSLGLRTLLAQQGFVLSPITPENTVTSVAMAQVVLQAKQMKFKEVQLFETQSFRLQRNGAPRGVFVNGRARPSEDLTSFVCFVTLVEPGRRPRLLRTIEGAVNGVPRCAGPRAVGVVNRDSLATEMRIGIVYDTTSAGHNDDGGAINPNGGETFITSPEPMVLGWDAAAHRLFLDQKATDKVSMAETLPALQKALR